MDIEQLEVEAPRTLKVRRPTDGQPLGEVPIQTADEVRAAVDRVRRVQKGWGTLAPDSPLPMTVTSACEIPPQMEAEGTL